MKNNFLKLVWLEGSEIDFEYKEITNLLAYLKN